MGISSFNFTRDAFYKGNWNKQTILARGLFIDTINNKIGDKISNYKFLKKILILSQLRIMIP